MRFRQHVLIVALALGLSCSTDHSRQRSDGSAWFDTRTLSQHMPATPEGVEKALEEHLGAPMIGGNKAELVENGAVFDALLEEVRKAQSSIHIVIFIWRPCEIGEKVAAAVAAKARQGVACRIVVDPTGSLRFGELAEGLRASGCDVRFYKPLTEVPPGEYLERTHRKIAVVDGKVAITGGFGIWKSWLGQGREREQWRDSNVRLEGPVVRQLQQAFEETWKEAGGGELPPDVYPKLSREGDARGMLVASSAAQELSQPSSAETMAAILIASAKKRLWIANSYFVPSDPMIELLAEKARRGVDVRVLAPGPVHDWKSIRAAQRDTYKPLLEAGVRIWEYQPSMMHSKTMLVDDRWVAVGSTNLDPLSQRQMEEDTVILQDEKLAGRQAKNFLEDLHFSKELKHPPGGLIERISRQFFWIIGRWL